MADGNGIVVASGFSPRIRGYIDDRYGFDTIEEMRLFEESSLPNGIKAFCEEDEKTYEYRRSNEVDETLGKWREFKSEVDIATTTTSGVVVVPADGGINIDGVGNIRVDKDKVATIETTIDIEGNKITTVKLGGTEVVTTETVDGEKKSIIGEIMISGKDTTTTTDRIIDGDGNVVETVVVKEGSSIGYKETTTTTTTKGDGSKVVVKETLNNPSGDKDKGVGTKEIVTTNISSDGSEETEIKTTITIDGVDVEVSAEIDEDDFMTKEDVDEMMKDIEW